MVARKPKDLQLAEIAYNAFYPDPQIPFDDLATSYQMRWVRVVRAAGRVRTPSNGGGSQPQKETKAPKKAKKGKEPLHKLSVERLNREIKEDEALFTDKMWKEKSKEEVAARHRVAYRKKVYGQYVQHNGMAQT